MKDCIMFSVSNLKRLGVYTFLLHRNFGIISRNKCELFQISKLSAHFFSTRGFKTCYNVKVSPSSINSLA
jgi:hypothetical protein